MSHSYVCDYIHYVFSTKHRRNLITPELEERLWPYLGGIARENRMVALAIGATPNHVHALVSLPSTLDVATGVQLIKGGSSKWVHETFPLHKDFDWQDGYGAFSISVSMIPQTVAYIQGQPAHHHTQTFEEEFIAFLKKHQIDYDPRYVFD